LRREYEEKEQLSGLNKTTTQGKQFLLKIKTMDDFDLLKTYRTDIAWRTVHPEKEKSYNMVITTYL
jgi:hypothetical protein